MNRTPELARRFFDRYEPIHAVTYFSPEARAAIEETGCRGFWSCYFATRAAPLAPASAQLVQALFYNFALSRVQRSWAAAQQTTSAEAGLRARLNGAVAALRRYGFADDQYRGHLDVAAELCAKAARSAPLDGRGLFAANAALPWPDDSLQQLWHATTLLREHRGDGHIAALVSVGVSGRESNILHAAAGGVPADSIKRSRDYDDAEWEACSAALADRGLLGADGSLTESGRHLKEHVEAVTDAAAVSALAGLDDDEVETLFGALTPLTRLVVAAGDVPATTPMGLRRDELDDASAHLR